MIFICFACVMFKKATDEITITEPMIAFIVGTSPKNMKTHMGRITGSIIQIIFALSGDTRFIPFEKQTYATPTWNTPRKISAIIAEGIRL